MSHQLERDLRRAIQSGRLRAGSPLPSTRTFAADLKLSRGGVVEAYQQLLAEGYLTSQHGSATRVAARKAHRDPAARPEQPVPSPRFDFRPGLPDLSLFPRRAWITSMQKVLGAAPDAAFDYPDPRGPREARVALATYLNRARATVVDPDRVIFCSGSAQGIGILCKVLRERGVRAVAVEDPGHADQCTDIRATGLETPRIPVDAAGLKTDFLVRTDVQAVLATPAHQYPTGAVLSPEHRAASLEWAEQKGAIVIEDDYDAEYRYDREPIGAMQGLAPDCSVYVGSASKVLSPAWVGVARRSVGTRWGGCAKLQADRGSSVLEQLTFADFLNRGAFDRHLRRTRPVYRRRRDVLAAALHARFRTFPIYGVAAGLHFMIELDGDVDQEAVVAAAARRSVRLHGARPYRANPRVGPPALIIGYGGISESDLPEAVSHLAAAVEEVHRRRRR